MPWAESTYGKGIRELCRKKIIDVVLEPLKQENEWKVFILDKPALLLISVCFTPKQLLSYNIALVAPLEEDRDPLPYLPAVYMMCPATDAIQRLIKDWDAKSDLYKESHLVFLSAVPKDIFNSLSVGVTHKVRTFKEIDILFLPYESQVFSLDDVSFFKTFFDVHQEMHMQHLEQIAKRLVSFFVVIQEIPVIRYRRSYVKNQIVAQAIENEMKKQRHLFPIDADTKNRCELLVLDRSFDCISPVVHEFTFQAMCYDILPIKDNVFLYELGLGERAPTMEAQVVPLDEDDPLWCNLRHKHIATVAAIVQDMIQSEAFMDHTKDIRQKYIRFPEVPLKVKLRLINKRNESSYSFRFMANACMKRYTEGLNVLTSFEQNLAMREDANEGPLENTREILKKMLLKESFTLHEKMRLILLYIFYKRGIEKEEFEEIIHEAKIPFSVAYPITNMLHLDIDIFKLRHCEPLDTYVNREEDDDFDEKRFKQSRWKPLLKDVISESLNGTLSEGHFPFLDIEERTKLKGIVRRGVWAKDKHPRLSRLVIFVNGGMTHSEMRCVYEAMKSHVEWEIFIGSDTILTPDTYLEKLKDLPCLFRDTKKT